MPQFEAAQGAAEVGDVQGSVGFGGGASYSDLRGIGRNRSLVLMDGRRLMPSTPDGAIDLNTIPMALIDSVEVITGGASATYGSDAVAGVANFKLKQHFSGVEMNVQHGASTNGDGKTTQVSGIVGGKLADDRGNVMLAFEYAKRDEVMGSQRSFFTQPTVRFLGRTPEGMIYKGGFGAGATAPTIADVNAILAGYAGTTPYPGSGPYLGAIGVNTDGTIFTSVVPGSLGCAQNYRGVGSVLGARLSPSCTQAGVVLGNYFAVQVPLTKYNALGSVDYRLTDHVTAYGQFNFSHSAALDATSPGSTKTNNTIELYIPVSNPMCRESALLSLINSAYGSRPPAPRWATPVIRVVIVRRYLLRRYLARRCRPEWSICRHPADVQSLCLVRAQCLRQPGERRHQPVRHQQRTGQRGRRRMQLQSVRPAARECGLRGLRRPDREHHRSADREGCRIVVPGTAVQHACRRGEIRIWRGLSPVEFAYQPDSVPSRATPCPGSSTPSSGSQNAKEAFGELLLPLLEDQALAKTYARPGIPVLEVRSLCGKAPGRPMPADGGRRRAPPRWIPVAFRAPSQ
jgi:hypothetical protein